MEPSCLSLVAPIKLPLLRLGPASSMRFCVVMSVTEAPTVYEALLCWRLTTDTGSIIELWELNTGDFELLFAESHKRDEIVHAVTLTLVEAELIGEKLAMATGAARSDA